MKHRINPGIPGLLLALGLAAAAGSSWARNDKLLLPIAPAIRGAQAMPPDVALAFGRASAGGLDPSAGGASVHAVADPFSTPNPNSGGQRFRRPDAVVCVDAFRKALADLQARARAAGATAVVGIVSNYDGVEMDSATMYECHIGHTRGVVDLRGVFTRGPVRPISQTGYFFATSGLQPRDTSMPSDPNERALLGCERNAKVQCKLYAVNGSVVWTREPR